MSSLDTAREAWELKYMKNEFRGIGKKAAMAKHREEKRNKKSGL